MQRVPHRIQQNKDKQYKNLISRTTCSYPWFRCMSNDEISKELFSSFFLVGATIHLAASIHTHVVSLTPSVEVF